MGYIDIVYAHQYGRTIEQAKHFAAALVKGDPEEAGIIKQSVKSMAQSILPHKG